MNLNFMFFGGIAFMFMVSFIVLGRLIMRMLKTENRRKLKRITSLIKI